MSTDLPSADESALPAASADQPGDRAVLLRRLERLPPGHPSSLAIDTGVHESAGRDLPDGMESMAGSRASFFEAMAVNAEVEPRSAEAGDAVLQHADADPLRALGRALETHPGEFQLAMERLDAAGVGVDQRPGSMSYSPSAVAGEPGRLILDREASYGALVHEMSHFADDEAAGFPGLRYWLEDPAVTAAGEERAYQAEIDYANSIGETAIADRLAELRDQRISELRGEGND